MRTSIAFAILGLLGSALAAPMPKADWVKKPGYRPKMHQPSRRALYVDQVAETTTYPTTTAPKENPWLYLSNDEAAAVILYLHDQDVLNLTAVDDAGAWDNSILVVDVSPPKKAEVKAYFDGNGTKPERYAVASLMFGATEEPFVQDFLVGPLPITNATTFVPDTGSNTAANASIRVYDADASYDYYSDVAWGMADIVSDLLNVTMDTEDDLNDIFSIWGIDPLWRETVDGEERVISWVQFWLNEPEITADDGTQVTFDGQTLTPQGLYLKFDITGRDSSLWSLKGILYADEFYETEDEFRAAWSAPGFNKLIPNYAGEWLGTDKVPNVTLPLETLPPPMQVQPAGQRFYIDPDQKYVEWMGFTFYLSFTRDTGMSLYDINFQGDRIIYELGMQEAVAHYAGNDPVQSGTAYLDSYYGFGMYTVTQVPGFDMPTYGTCLDSNVHASEVSKQHPCAISIFESDAGYALQRHSTSSYVSTTKNIALVVRSVATVGNYDYTTSYSFFLDGTIEVMIQASGYIQSAYYYANEGYGYKIHDNLSGSMHDHSLNYKVDFDILGGKNTMIKHSVEPVTKAFKWSNGVERNTMHIVEKEIVNEDHGKQFWGANGKDHVIVVNKDTPNKYGEYRGYRMSPSKGGAGMHVTIANSTNLANAGGFTTHAYYVTKHHDSETRAASAWSDYDPWNPMRDFNTYFDGEDIEQEDIVVWFNLGMHHVPHTGDIPNTVMTTAQSAMLLTPNNYFLSDPSRQVTNMMRINYGADNVSTADTFGSVAPNGTINLENNLWDPYTYSGDVAVRKFPYDPTNPYNDTESIV